MGMIHRIHRYPSDGGPNSAPTLSTCLTEFAQIVFVVTDFANGSSTIDVYPPHLSRAQTQSRVPALTSDDLNRAARASCELTAFPWLHLHAVHERADWNVFQWKSITGLDRGIGTGQNRITGFAPSRRQNVASLSIHIQHESEMSTPIRVILDTLNATGNPVFVSLEIDDSVVAFVSTSLVSRRDAAVVITTTCLRHRGE
jgi:hypothetical protein